MLTTATAAPPSVPTSARASTDRTCRRHHLGDLRACGVSTNALGKVPDAVCILAADRARAPARNAPFGGADDRVLRLGNAGREWRPFVAGRLVPAGCALAGAGTIGV